MAEARRHRVLVVDDNPATRYSTGRVLRAANFEVAEAATGNEALARVTPDDPDSKVVWERYVAEWTAWNHVRTAASLAACASFTAAIGR